MLTVAQRVGARMKQAAEDAGLNNREVGRLLDYSGTVTAARWYSGQSQPSFADMARFAELVGRPLHWFFMIEPEDDDWAAFVVDTLVSILFRLLSGEDPADATAGELGDPAAISPSVRRLLEESAEAAREELNDLCGGFLDLPHAERRRRLRRIVNSYLDADAL